MNRTTGAAPSPRPATGKAALLALIGSALACSSLQASDPSPAPEEGDAPRLGSATIGDGKAQYAALCASCHGAAGEGVHGPALRDWSKGLDTLVRVIDARMPVGAPETCRGACAEDIATYILDALSGRIACGPNDLLGRRTLRLLNRREYRATVRDLLNLEAATEASPACPPRTFTFQAGERALRSVHVAGSFNGWASTLAAGGDPLAPPARSGDAWTLVKALPEGTHAYKFVLDERDWVADPQNPHTAPDGMGGRNSIARVTCATRPPEADDFAAALPPDTRPEGFPFDTHGPARVVTTVHVEEYLRIAHTLSGRALEQVNRVAPCSTGTEPRACAEAFVTMFGRRAFRRPLTNEERARYVTLFHQASSYVNGVERVTRALLSSPHFLYRSELGIGDEQRGFTLDGYERATALSYALWGTTPDDALLDAAGRGELDTQSGLAAAARRLLADRRARDAVATFAEQWLGAENILSVDKLESVYPDATPALRAAMLEETRRFVVHVLFDSSHEVSELYDAPYSFLNEGLAGLYGVPGIQGDALRKTPWGDVPRAGILGHASVLGTAAHSDQSSPIRRGLLVRRALLCQEFGAPPPNAGGVPRVEPGATTRERFAQHSSDPACASCHTYIDPVGFGFERFDGLGRARNTENGRPIDAQGDMVDVERLGAGTHAPFSSLPELGRTLANAESTKTCFAKQYFRFVRGYRESSDDLCSIQSLRDRLEAHGGDVRELLIGIVTSPDFMRRRP